MRAPPDPHALAISDIYGSDSSLVKHLCEYVGIYLFPFFEKSRNLSNRWGKIPFGLLALLSDSTPSLSAPMVRILRGILDRNHATMAHIGHITIPVSRDLMRENII
jgi:hypothetical protein